ncbi:MAG: 1-acyl-sn-glycerol-3-phosphate acyltransferase [Gemmatimonadota bacterium]
MVAPHTSNWDFFLCIMAMWGFGLQLSWLGKHGIFFWPARYLLRWLGGEPIDRDTPLGTVEQAIERFATRAQWVFGLAPEGTRKQTTGWKSGYYRIAVGARVPIVPVALDHGRRRVVILEPCWPTGDQAADERRLRAHFSPGMARHPEQYGSGTAEIPSGQ